MLVMSVGEAPDDAVVVSSFGVDEEVSGVVDDDESTLLLLEGGATLGDLDELKYPAPRTVSKLVDQVSKFMWNLTPRHVF